MRTIFKTVAALSLSAIAAATASQAEEYNWMRELVQLRVAAMNSRATGEPVQLSSRSSRIVGGTVAPNSVHKFQVGLLTKSIANNFNAQFCGGTLVKPNFIVTAAHCSEGTNPADVQVLTGTQDLDGTGVRRNVTQIFIHPQFNNVTFDFDVAVWKLATNASGIPLATLTTTDAPTGTSVKTTGWGALNEGGSFPINLRQVNVPIVSKANCNDANSYSGDITTRMICAGLDAGGKDSCQGDSGGPLTRNEGAGFKVLTGIVSFGEGCARPNKFGVYTRIANNAIRNFIVNKIGP